MVNSNSLPVNKGKLILVEDFSQNAPRPIGELGITREDNYYNNSYNVITNGVGMVTWARNKLSQNTGPTKSGKKKEYYTEILRIALWALQQYEKIVLNYKLDGNIVKCILQSGITKVSMLKNLISSLVIILDNKLMNSKTVSSLNTSNSTNSITEYTAPDVPLELLNIFTFKPELEVAAWARAAAAGAGAAAAGAGAAAAAGL